MSNEVLAAVDRFSEALWSGDREAWRFFASRPDIMCVASGDGPAAHGPSEVQALFTNLVEQPFRLRVDFHERHVRTSGDLAWMYGVGELVVVQDDLEQRRSYRMTAVLQKLDGEWRWLHYHGAEPR